MFFYHLSRRVCFAAILALAGSAFAQSPPVSPTTPALSFRSALETYRPHADEPVGDWRKANDEVGRIGGWRTYAREAAGPSVTEAVPKTDQPAGNAAAPPPAGANDPHAGHAMPKKAAP
jgi:hypothetical protein